MTQLTDLPPEVLELICLGLPRESVMGLWATGTAFAAQWQGVMPDNRCYEQVYQSLFGIMPGEDEYDDRDDDDDDEGCQCGRPRCPRCAPRVRQERAAERQHYGRDAW